MRIGVISEGHADRAVISNLLIGLLNVDLQEIQPLRPTYNLDETDKANMKPENFSSWSLIKYECENKDLLEGFLAIEGQDFVVIHIDSAECSDYGVNRPNLKKSDEYCGRLRANIIEQMNVWLNDELLCNNILFAIAIEEIDAWVMTIYDKNKSCDSVTPKEKLGRLLGKKGINSISDFDNYLKLTKKFSKQKEIKKEKYCSYNCSLNAFCAEVIEKVTNLINS